MKINKSELQKALEIVKPGLANKEIIEQSNSFAFINNRVITYNDEISLSHPIEGIEIEGCIKAEELYKLLAKIKKEEIELTQEENQILISSGRMKAKFILQSEVKLPIEEISKPGKWKTLPDNFCHYLDLASKVCGKDFSKPILTCVNVRKDGLIEASDNYRVIRAELGQEMPVKTFLIPASSVIEINRLNPVKIAEGSGWIHFKTDEETILSCRTFADEFPDIEKFLNIEGISITFPKTLVDILGRASVFSKRDHFLEEMINISIKEKKIQIKSESDYGSFEEKANILYEEEPISFNITPHLFIDILAKNTTAILGENMIKFEGLGWVIVIVLKTFKDSGNDS